jgi:hypothetical protein
MAAKTKSTPPSTNGNKPVMVFKGKFGVRVSIWENAAAEGERKFCKSALQKIYKDDSGEFKTTNSLSSVENLVAARLLEKAHDWMAERERALSDEESLP